MVMTMERSSAKEMEKSNGIAISITELKAGETGSVVRIEGEPNLRQHLMEMGFTTGTTVEFVRQAPMGDPVDLRVRGYRLSLRRIEAAAVVVIPRK
jgi:Fe2+ transport system protein FeoA